MTTSTINININTFANNLATATRKTLEASAPFHTCYAGADAAGKKQLRVEWMLGYLQGALNVGATKVESILSTGKGAGANAVHIKAIDRATADFRYHIVRPVKGNVVVQELTVPAKIQAMANALAQACAAYEGARKLASTAVANSFAK